MGAFFLLNRYSGQSHMENADVPKLEIVEKILERIKKPSDLCMVSHKAGQANGHPLSESNKNASKDNNWKTLQQQLSVHRRLTRECKDQDDMPVLVLVMQEIGCLTSSIALFRAFVLTVARMAGGKKIWVMDCSPPPVLINLYVMAQVLSVPEQPSVPPPTLTYLHNTVTYQIFVRESFDGSRPEYLEVLVRQAVKAELVPWRGQQYPAFVKLHKRLMARFRIV